MLPSEFLAKLDGHGIYSADMLSELPDTISDLVPTFTHKQTQQIMNNRGLGGSLAADDGRKMIYGYSTAQALASALVGRTSQKMGRGSGFRENVDILREAGH